MLTITLVIILIILIIWYYSLDYHYSKKCDSTIDEYFKIDKRLPSNVGKSLESIDGTKQIKIFDIEERDKENMIKIEDDTLNRLSSRSKTSNKSNYYDAVDATFKTKSMLSDEEPSVIGGFDKKRTGTMPNGSVESRDKRLIVNKNSSPSRETDRDGYKNM